jgi:hypothetical protein
MLSYTNAYSFTNTDSIRAIMPSLLFTDRNFYRYADHSTAKPKPHCYIPSVANADSTNSNANSYSDSASYAASKTSAYSGITPVAGSMEKKSTA